MNESGTFIGRGIRRFGMRVATIMFVLASAIAAEETPVGEKPMGWVERALFTSGVADREPVDAIALVEGASREVYFFTELKQLSGRTVTHRWEYAGEVVSEMPFEVGGPRWRVFSKKALAPEQAGKWSVLVVDESGWVLHAEMFEYRP